MRYYETTRIYTGNSARYASAYTGQAYVSAYTEVMRKWMLSGVKQCVVIGVSKLTVLVIAQIRLRFISM